MEVQVIPISKDSTEWQCSVLKFSGITVLLNCGWKDSLDVGLLSGLLPHIAEIDLILLSHATIQHSGGLPFLLSKYPVTCPVVATEAVCRIGELTCVAALEDREKYETPSEHISVDEVLRSFMNRITAVKYEETKTYDIRGQSFTVCAHQAGGQLGAASWTLKCSAETIIYLAEYDLRSGRYLDGLDLAQLTLGSSVLITSLPQLGDRCLPRLGGTRPPQAKAMQAASRAMGASRNAAEEIFLEETIGALRNGGTVLVPADAGGQVLEMMLLLEEAWGRDRQLALSYPVCWVSSIGDMLLDQAKTRVEWMGYEAVKAFEARFGHNPFVFRNIKVFSSLDELLQAYPAECPRVVLTTLASLEGGDSRELFLRLCDDPRNLVWLCGNPQKDTLAWQLLDDFVLHNAVRKEYRLQQHVKHVLPDEQLRAFYDGKILEESMEESEREVGVKAQANARLIKKEDPEKKGDDEKNELGTQGIKQESGGIKSEILEGKRPGVQQPGGGPIQTGPLLIPIGWPMSRTFAQQETRAERDDYGDVLTAAELKAWRSQDQEGNKYSGFPNAGDREGPPEVENLDEDEVDDMPKLEQKEVGWREDLRIRFGEPMRSEVVARLVRVTCRVQYLPDSREEPQDFRAVIAALRPKHVMMLPTGQEEAEVAFSLHVQSGATPAEVVRCGAEGATVKLKGAKRKVSFAPGMWQNLQFQSALCDMKATKVARIRAPMPESPVDSASTAAATTEVLLEELQVNGGPPKEQKNGKQENGEEEESPKEGLFLGLGEASLSTLQNLLQKQDGLDGVHFRAPLERDKNKSPGAAKPWSARALQVGPQAAMGWRGVGAQKSQVDSSAPPTLRLEGVPGVQFFRARNELYKQSLLI